MEDNVRQRYIASAVVCGVCLGACAAMAILVEVLKNASFKVSFPAEMLPIIRYTFYALAFSEVVALQILRQIVLRPKEDGKIRVEQLQTAAIVTTALCESLAAYGLLLYVLGRFYTDFYVLLILSVLLQIFYFPKLQQWRSILEEQA